jgi:hypothetical protein
MQSQFRSIPPHVAGFKLFKPLPDCHVQNSKDDFFFGDWMRKTSFITIGSKGNIFGKQQWRMQNKDEQ